ncbi:MAG: hypothetical protein K5683_09645 [Prevotella sp.]|nr:hypothetical protein [Prevotella sp.]
MDDHHHGCQQQLPSSRFIVEPTSVPTIGTTDNVTHAFDNTNGCPIYVPTDKVNDYKASWIKYALRIKPMDSDVSESLLGDVNGDGSINNIDVTALIYMILG